MPPGAASPNSNTTRDGTLRPRAEARKSHTADCRQEIAPSHSDHLAGVVQANLLQPNRRDETVP
jgi:hypothetical protein